MTRPYRATRRAHRAFETRRAIRTAATTLFLRDGYARTSMTAIAVAAGVSEKTMYLTYATKANLLSHVISVAVRGDENPETLSQRREWQVFDGPPERALERFAALTAALMARTAAIIAVGEAAATADPEIAAYRDQAHAAGRADVRAFVSALNRAGALADDVDERDAADIAYALAADESIYLRLTQECGWTDARYAQFLAHTLNATIGKTATPASDGT